MGQEVTCELGSASDRLDRVRRHAKVISERSSTQLEKDSVNSTVESLSDQLTQIRSILDEKKSALGDSLESWQVFIGLYNGLHSWAAKHRAFLAETLKLATLQEARTKLQEYATACKEVKWATKQVVEMQAELAKIGQCGDAAAP